MNVTNQLAKKIEWGSLSNSLPKAESSSLPARVSGVAQLSLQSSQVEDRAQVVTSNKLTSYPVDKKALRKAYDTLIGRNLEVLPRAKEVLEEFKSTSRDCKYTCRDISNYVQSWNRTEAKKTKECQTHKTDGTPFLSKFPKDLIVLERVYEEIKQKVSGDGESKINNTEVCDTFNSELKRLGIDREYTYEAVRYQLNKKSKAATAASDGERIYKREGRFYLSDFPSDKSVLEEVYETEKQNLKGDNLTAAKLLPIFNSALFLLGTRRFYEYNDICSYVRRRNSESRSPEAVTGKRDFEEAGLESESLSS